MGYLGRLWLGKGCLILSRIMVLRRAWLTSWGLALEFGLGLGYG